MFLTLQSKFSLYLGKIKVKPQQLISPSVKDGQLSPLNSWIIIPLVKSTLCIYQKVKQLLHVMFFDKTK